MAGAGPETTAAPAPGEPLRTWPRLSAGDRVALISPSSHQGRTPAHFLPQAVQVLEGWGLAVAPLPDPEPRHLYFAGTDAERAAAFQAAWLDPDLRALFVTRGGYGAARILPLLDGPRIAAAPPKAVVGFSDATALFAWLHRTAGVQAVHGPCLAAPGALSAAGRETSLTALRDVLFDGVRPAFPLTPLHEPPELDAGGPLRGVLQGGCLSVWVSLAGTPWLPDPRGTVLLLEDVGEAPYRIDRMLTHLRQAGAFEGLRAVVFGYLTDCDGDPPGLLMDVLRDLFRDAPFPVFTGLPAGHGDPNLPLPLGAAVEIAPGEGQHPVLRVL